MMRKKYKHWTQDPANRAKLARVRKTAVLAKRAKKKAKAATTTTTTGSHDDGQEERIAFITGYTLARLETFAASEGIPTADVARRVGQLLLRSAGRQVRRADD